jgi:hypothetical protein
MSWNNPTELSADELKRARESVAAKVSARQRRRKARTYTLTSSLAVIAAGALIILNVPSTTGPLSTIGPGPNTSSTYPSRASTTTPTTVHVGRGVSGSGFPYFWIPDVVGEPQTQALNNQYVKILTVYLVSDPSSSAPSGTIVSEVVTTSTGAPAGIGIPNEYLYPGEIEGVTATVGNVIGLTVSGGPQNVDVPSVVGLSETVALQQMSQFGLEDGPEGYCESINPDNTVRAEYPVAGTAVEPGSRITLEIQGC